METSGLQGSGLDRGYLLLIILCNRGGQHDKKKKYGIRVRRYQIVIISELYSH